MEASKILILSDLDGTFLGSGSAVVERNIKAIDDFKAKGGLFSFASGRVPPMMRMTYPDFDRIINAPAVLCNGGCLYDPTSDSYIYEKKMDGEFCYEVLTELLSLFKLSGYVVYTDDYEYNTEINPDFKNRKWNKFCLSGEPDELCRAKAYLDEKYGDKFNMIRSSAMFLEIVDKAVAKGNMIAYIKDYYKKLGREVTVCCIGDYENDIDMLSKADESFCPSNSYDEVKKIAKHIVCSNNDGAIADLIDIMLKK